MKLKTRLRTHTCGELTLKDVGQTVTLCGWLHRSRDLGGMTFIDLRDRYGITQLVFNPDSKVGAGIDTNKELCGQARKLGREFVLCVTGKVVERTNKNPKIPTGEIEIIVEQLQVLNQSKTPPFTIEDETDGGDEVRMKYRYLDLRRKPVAQNIILRHKVAQAVRHYFDENNFVDIETPFLIKSTPEGARDFVVPSRMNPGEFYALPQSPQTFKQLLMVSGFDRYYQIVRCFRDEDLRADRQPEFTQIDCEMAFVEREDVLQMFEGMVKHVFKKVRGIELSDFPRMTFDDAVKNYGTDKPDLRLEMKIVCLTPTLSEGEGENLVRGKSFKVFDEAESVAGICAGGCAGYTRKQTDELTEWVKRPQIGAGGLAYIKYNPDGTLKSSFDKFFDETSLKKIAEKFSAKPGDLILILAGAEDKTRRALGELRLEMGNRLGLRKKDAFKPLWVVDFPLLEWNEEEQRWFAMHHPFTSPKKENIDLLYSMGQTNSLPNGEGGGGAFPRANAYDIVVNGVELGGGSIRIHDRKLQEQMFKVLGLTKEETEKKFGFLLNAFEYGAPPHGGIAFGFDRLCSMVINNEDYIRDYIAFPKNNSAVDVMLESPSYIDKKQLDELSISLHYPKIINYWESQKDFEKSERFYKEYFNDKNRDSKYMKEHGMINNNNPLNAKYEYLENYFVEKLGLKKIFLPHNAYDAIDEKTNDKYEIKIRNLKTSERQSFVIHKKKNIEFDYIIFVLLSDKIDKSRLFKMDVKQFKKLHSINTNSNDIRIPFPVKEEFLRKYHIEEIFNYRLK